MAGIHHSRPRPDDIAPAVEGPAINIGDGIWMSPGVSNSYAVETDEGRVIINAGLHVEGPIHRRAYDATCPGRTSAIIVTQSHADHFAGITSLREEGTEIIGQANHRFWRDDHDRLPNRRARNASFAWGHTMDAMVALLDKLPRDEWQISYTDPTVVVEDRLELTIGGRRFVLISTPGGETTDAMVVWLPDDGVVFTGNLFGPLFGHVPNLVTIRGDRYREAVLYVDGANAVLDLGVKRLITGHFDPIEGADLIADEVTALRDAMQWVHDRTVEGMEAGTDVHTLMRDIRLPSTFDIGEAYGKTSWNVRAIWETYAGWFHHRSTTELYEVPAANVAGDLVAAAGADALVAAARTRLSAGEPVAAIHILDIVLAAQPQHADAHTAAAEAHDLLLARSTNFWETAWVRRAADQHRKGSQS